MIAVVPWLGSRPRPLADWNMSTVQVAEEAVTLFVKVSTIHPVGLLAAGYWQFPRPSEYDEAPVAGMVAEVEPYY